MDPTIQPAEQLTAPDTSAAANLATTLAEFDTTPTATAPPTDDFLSSFDDVLDPNAAPPEPAGTPPKTPAAEPAASPEPAGTEDPDVPFAEEPPGKPTQAAKDTWKEMRSAIKEKAAKLREKEAWAAEEIRKRETELAELRKKIVELPELAEKAKLAEDAERELAIARVEGTREYKDTILAPLEAIEKAAESIATKNGLKIDAILDVLTENDPDKQRDALEELVSGLRTVDQLTVVRMAEDTRQLLAKREQMRTRATEAKRELEEIERKRTEAAAKATKDAYSGEVDRYTAELSKRVPFVPLAEGETPDGVFGVLRDKAKASDFDSATPGTKAFASLAAVMLPRVTKQLVKLQEENKVLQARIAENAAAKPTISTPAVALPADKNDDDFMGGFTDLLQGFGRSRPITDLLAD